MRHDRGHVVVEQGARLGGGPRARGHPRGQLAVPDERVPAHLHAVELREGDERIGWIEPIAGLRGVDVGVLHVVLGSQHAELPRERAAELGGRGPGVAKPLVHGSAQANAVRRRQRAQRNGVRICRDRRRDRRSHGRCDAVSAARGGAGDEERERAPASHR